MILAEDCVRQDGSVHTDGAVVVADPWLRDALVAGLRDIDARPDTHFALGVRVAVVLKRVAIADPRTGDVCLRWRFATRQDRMNYLLHAPA